MLGVLSEWATRAPRPVVATVLTGPLEQRPNGSDRTLTQEIGDRVEVACLHVGPLCVVKVICSDYRLMTSTEETTDNSTTERITLTITDLELPENGVERRALLDTLRETLTEQLQSKFDQPTGEITACVGYQYASVSPTCPDCGESLELLDIHLGEDRDAYAVARCAATCGWTGDGVFTLTDLDRHVGESYESEVLSGDVTPDYQSYRQRTD